MSILSDISSLFSSSSSSDNADYIGGSDMGGYTGSGNNQDTYGPYGNLSRAEYQKQYGGRDQPQQQRSSGDGGGKPKPKTIDELMAEFDVSQYVPTTPATSYMPFYNAIPLDYANTAGPQSPALGMDYGNMVQQSLLAAPQASMPSGILGPSVQSQTPLTAPISYEDFLRYYRGGV
jgi:hypothetical protein